MRGFLICMVCLLACCLLLLPVGSQDCEAAWDCQPCAAGACVAGQPVRNVGRLAVAPVRAVLAVQPVRRVGRAILVAKPVRRVALVASAPVRWLLR